MINFSKNLILYILILPIIGVVTITLTPSDEFQVIKVIAFNSSVLTFFCSLLLWLIFSNTYCFFQFVLKFIWIPRFNIVFTIGIDGISIVFVILTTFLITLCVLNSWKNVNIQIKNFLICFLLLEFFLICAFCVLDLLFFYVFFESILIPMFFIIGVWGSREWKTLASYYFFFYTIVSSCLMLVTILYIYCSLGTTNYDLLWHFQFTITERKFFSISFFIAFACKVPMIPAHLWLPEAHVEAPTPGSVILAGVLLKLGIYGFIWFSIPLFRSIYYFFTPFIFCIAVSSIIYTSFTAIRQTDFKRIIAYTSIAHLNFVVLGIFSRTVLSLEGVILQSLSHGFVASSLFLVIGVVYDRYKTRIVSHYGGLASVMPLYASIFLFFTLANMGFPGTSSFVAEFLILLGSYSVNTTITVIGSIGIVLSGIYSLWLFNRISYGNIKTQYMETFIDLSLREITLFVPLLLAILSLGICPEIFLKSFKMSVLSFFTEKYPICYVQFVKLLNWRKWTNDFTKGFISDFHILAYERRKDKESRFFNYLIYSSTLYNFPLLNYKYSILLRNYMEKDFFDTRRNHKKLFMEYDIAMELSPLNGIFFKLF